MIPNCRFSKVCVKGILVILFALLSFLFVRALLKVNFFAIRFKKITDNGVLVNILLLIAFIFVILAIYKLIDKCNRKVLRLIVIISFAIIAIVQIVLALKINMRFTTDAFFVNDQAMAIAKGINKNIDTTKPYFHVVSNNNFIVLFLAVFYKIFSFLGIDKYTVHLFLFNAVLIDASIFMIYRIIKICFNNKVATKFVILSLLNPINYFMIFWVYSAVFSVPLTVGAVYLAVSVWKSTDGFCPKNCVKIGGLALVSVVGFFLRPTVLIPVVASALCVVLLVKISKKSLKHIAIYFAIFAAVGIASYATLNKVIYSFVPDTSGYFPTTHYIMLGLDHDGKINLDSVNYTMKYKTKSEKQAANIRRIKQLAKKRGFLGISKLYLNKTADTFTDGSNAYTAITRFVQDEGNIFNWLFGEKCDLVLIYCQVFRIFTLLFAAILILFRFFKKKVDPDFLVSLTVLGGIIFYMIWEAKETYSLPFIPLLIMMACIGVEKTAETSQAQKVFSLKPLMIASLCVIEVATLFMGITLKEGFTKTQFPNLDYSLFSYKHSSQNRVGNLAAKNGVITQTFYTKNPFTIIEVQARKKNDKPGDYAISLESNGKVLCKRVAPPEFANNERLALLVGEQRPKGLQKYTVKIKPLSKNDSLEFSYDVYTAMKQYDGELIVNGKKPKGTLALRAYKQFNAPLMSTFTYWFIIVSLMIIEAIAFTILIIKRKE